MSVIKPARKPKEGSAQPGHRAPVAATPSRGRGASPENRTCRRGTIVVGDELLDLAPVVRQRSDGPHRRRTRAPSGPGELTEGATKVHLGINQRGNSRHVVLVPEPFVELPQRATVRSA